MIFFFSKFSIKVKFSSHYKVIVWMPYVWKQLSFHLFFSFYHFHWPTIALFHWQYMILYLLHLFLSLIELNLNVSTLLCCSRLRWLFRDNVKFIFWSMMKGMVGIKTHNNIEDSQFFFEPFKCLKHLFCLLNFMLFGCKMSTYQKVLFFTKKESSVFVKV